MKKIITVALGLLVFSCNSNKNVGVSKDEQGCNIAAGETWSELNKDCIQVFNVGKRLNPLQEAKDSAVLSAFALVNADNTKCEIFIPEQKSSIILNKTEDGIFTNEVYEYNNNTSTLLKDKNIIYKGDNN